jgi:hypothetical protein
MFGAGYSKHDFANALNISQSVVDRAWKRQQTSVQLHTDMWVVVRGRQPIAKTILWLFRHDVILSGQHPVYVTTS